MPTPLQPSPHLSKAAAPATAAAAPLSAPRAAWPSQAGFLAHVEALGQQRCEDAFERYSRAKKEAASYAKSLHAEPPWTCDAEIMHPELHASCVRRKDDEAHKLVQYGQRTEQLWRAYSDEIAASGRINDTIARLRPPPRLVDLVGGIYAFAALPELTRSTSIPTHPIMRGQDGSGRQFVTLAFCADENQGLGPKFSDGVITLMQALPDIDSPWLMLNPNRFRPPGRMWRDNITPTFPNMAGRGAMVGGPDAQAMLAGIRSLISDGRLGPYRLKPF